MADGPDGQGQQELTWTPRSGAHLKGARQRAGLRRVDLAVQLGVSDETLRLWEKGAVQPSPERLARLIAVTALETYEWTALPDLGTPEIPVLAQRLRAERAGRGMTQAEAIRILDVPQATYAGWETGRSTPGAHLMPAVAAFLGLAEEEVAVLCASDFVVDTHEWPPFGQLLGARRQALRLTRPDLAAEIGVSVGTIVAWELGYRTPGPTQLPRLATALSVGMTTLASALPERRADTGLGELILARKRALGLRSADLARLLGTAEATVSRWVNGRSRPAERNLRRLSDILKVPYASILDAIGDPA